MWWQTEVIDGAVTNFSPPPSNPPKKTGLQIAEIVGVKTAECAAIFCCCPCGIANLFILATVRFPAGICRRAVRKRMLIRRARKKVGMVGSGSDGGSGSGSSKEGSQIEDEFGEFSGMRGRVVGDRWPERSPAAEVVELEKEVWSKFYSSGFWRSLSQKDLQ